MLTFNKYKAMRLRGEKLPRMQKGICPLCGEAFDVSWKGTHRVACEACAPMLRGWQIRINNDLKCERRKQLKKTTQTTPQQPQQTMLIQQKNQPKDLWVVKTFDGYCYEASPTLGF